jgi:hypothetical protein
MSFKTTVVGCLIALANPVHAAPPIPASAFVESLYEGAAQRNAISYYDVQLGNQFHMYFSFRSDSPLERWQWTTERFKREVLPLLEEFACDSTSKARPGDTPDWTEFRRAGGGLVIHVADFTDSAFEIRVSARPKSEGCRSAPGGKAEGAQ